MRILFTSDTHVHPAHLDRFLGSARALLPHAAIVDGDINPNWKGSIAASIEPHIRWIEKKFLPRVEAFHREHPEIPLLVDFGNDDIAAARRLVEEKDGTVLHLLHMRVVGLSENLAVAGYMAVNPTPFRIKDLEKADSRDWDGLSPPGIARSGSTTAGGVETPCTLDPSDGTIEEDLDLLSEILESDPWRNSSFVFVSHAPPRGTVLDRIGGGIGVGSLAVRRFIERWGRTGRLVCSLHGHIHESPRVSGCAWQYVGDVPAFNAGQQKETLRAILLETGDPAGSARLVTSTAPGEVTVAEPGVWLR